EIWLIRVVFPAPFGPITACSSPGSISSVTPSVTTSPPKFFCTSLISSTASVTAPPSSDGAGKAEKSPGQKHNNEPKQRTEDSLPLFGDAAPYFFDEKIARSADDRAIQAANPAEQNHDDQFARTLPRHIRRADELGRIGKQETGESANGA